MNLQRGCHAEGRFAGPLLGGLGLPEPQRVSNPGTELGIGKLEHDGRSVELDDGGGGEGRAVRERRPPRTLRAAAMLVLGILGPQANPRFGDDILLAVLVAQGVGALPAGGLVHDSRNSGVGENVDAVHEDLGVAEHSRSAAS